MSEIHLRKYGVEFTVDFELFEVDSSLPRVVDIQSVVAIWNAPQSQTGHAMLAVKAALEAQQKVSELDNSESDPSAPPVLRWGIGINTGIALAGNVGSAKRAEYTVIGDTVNLAARICGGAPGGDVWISDQTYDQVREYLEVEEMERQSFKGKSTSTQVYRVKGLLPLKENGTRRGQKNPPAGWTRV